MKEINIAKEYSETPGARYTTDGPFSGEEFRKTFLEPLFADPNDNSEIRIILDGVIGYASSFLEESFGGLVRLYGKERVSRRLSFLSEEIPLRIKEIEKIINEAEMKKK